VRCRVLQCVSVCCSVLQCAQHRSRSLLMCRDMCVLQCVAVCYSVLQCVTVCYSVLQCVAVCCSVLQCVAVCCSVLQWVHCRSRSHICLCFICEHPVCCSGFIADLDLISVCVSYVNIRIGAAFNSSVPHTPRYTATRMLQHTRCSTHAATQCNNNTQLAPHTTPCYHTHTTTPAETQDYPRDSTKALPWQGNRPQTAQTRDYPRDSTTVLPSRDTPPQTAQTQDYPRDSTRGGASQGNRPQIARTRDCPRDSMMALPWRGNRPQTVRGERTSCEGNLEGGRVRDRGRGWWGE